MNLHFVNSADGVVDVRAEGPLTPDAPSMFTERLVELCGPRVYEQQLRLDLSEADFISSAGIGGLLEGHRRFAEHGGGLLLRSPSRTIRQTLELLRLQQVLTIE
jgi:anti-anti-sigma factor